MTLSVLAALPMMMYVGVAIGHPAPAIESRWHWEPWFLACLALAGAAYGSGVHRLGSTRVRRVLGAGRCLAFAAGLATLAIALLSPLDELADHSFAVHMVQHLLLLLVAPPLLVWGRPGVIWLWAFPPAARRALAHAWTGMAGGQRAFRFLSRPAPVYALSTLMLWFWHLPGPYGWALGNEAIHAAEHGCFLVSALAFWSLVLDPYGSRRLGYGMTLLFVATYGLQNGLLGGILALAGRSLYQAYAHGSGFDGLTPLEDQQLAGLIMWIPASLIHLSTLAALFVAWMESAERRAQKAAAVTAPAYLHTLR